MTILRDFFTSTVYHATLKKSCKSRALRSTVIQCHQTSSLWKTLQATLLFYLMYVCVFIYTNDSLLMIIYKYEKIIRLDALVSTRDMGVRVWSPATWSASCWEKKYILIHCYVKMRAKILMFSLNVIFVGRHNSKSTMTSLDVLWRHNTRLHVNGYFT